MNKRKKIILWLLMIASMPATYYAGLSVVFYLWLNAAEPERWPTEKASLWAGGALVLTVIFISIFIYCVVSLIKNANKEYREKQNA